MITETSIHHERTFSEIKRLSSAGLEGPELLRRVGERLKLTIPFEAYSGGTLDPASNLLTHLLGEGFGEMNDEVCNIFLDRVYFEEDLGQIYSMLRERRTVRLLSEIKLDRSVRYREIRRPFGFGYEAAAAFADGSLWGGIMLIREAGDPDFSSSEVALMKRIVPHVGAGLKAAALRSRATDRTTDQETKDAPGVLTLDRSRRIVSYTPSAEHWLRDLEALHPAWRESHSLPVAVRMVDSALRCSLEHASDRKLNLIPKIRVRGRSGRWLTLYGSLSESTSERPSETVIVVEPAKPEEVAWLNVAAHGLSPREEEVLKLVVRGLSNRRISKELYISENTVQRHLSNIFEKVGVRSRKELLKRLFFENLLPGMLDG
jgi:DNA-binding CsgD family transcriptional regulator